MHKLKIIYMGTPDFAVHPLKKLIEEGFNVVAVVTNPDKPAGRGQKIQESPVKKFAVENNIPVLQPNKFRDEEFLSQLKQFDADLQFVVAFKMLPEVVWNMPRLGTVNLHASLLPDYRGAAPINWAIMNGEKQTGVTTFLLKHEIDTGNLIFQEKIDIPDNMTAGDLHDKLMTIGADLVVKTAKAIEENNFPLVDQTGLLSGREPKHAPKIFKEDMKINWYDSVNRIYNHIRGLSPFPAAWSELINRQTSEVISFKIYNIEKVIDDRIQEVNFQTDGKTYFDIHVKGGVIKIKELQLSGKKRMKTDEFLRGFKLEDYKI